MRPIVAPGVESATMARGPIPRRRFIALALAASLAPLAAAAQRAEKARRIGILVPTAATGLNNFDVFFDGMRALGYVEGRNLLVERRFADGRDDLLPGLAADLVKQGVEIIVAAGPGATRAAHATTSTVPILMGTFDPVEQGLVASLARPGGNMTGWCILTTESVEKQLSMLNEAVPGLVRVAILATPRGARYVESAERIANAARALGITLKVVPVPNEEALDTSFAAARRDRADAVLVLPEPEIDRLRDRLAPLAVRHRVPTMYTWRFYVDAGGLMSYGANLRTMMAIWPSYADKILKGARPGELPVQTPTKYELVLNQRAAREIGFTFPGALLLAADAVIT